jgi:RNA polymerase sporulation-specific sigma factor
LEGRERKVIELRYGILNGIEKTQKEVGNMLGISRSYVSRIEKHALEKLYSSMETQN